MIPEYRQEDFFTGEGREGTEVAPACDFRDISDFATLMVCSSDTVELVRDRFWARLTAPGYLDATEWLGPFETLTEAQEALEEHFCIDAETGESVDDG